MSRFVQYVADQPEVIRIIAQAYCPGGEFSPNLQEATKLLKSRPNVLLLGMGSSLFASELFAQYSGLPAFVHDTSELIHYRRHLLDADASVIAISQSGESVETRKAAAMFARRNPLVAICNDIGSSVARQSDVVLPMLAGEELGPSCKTYVATLAILHLLIGSLQGNVGACVDMLEDAARCMEEAVQRGREAVSSFFDRCTSARSFVYLGRGPGVVTASQGALMTKEMTSLHAEAMSAGQYRHGPIEIAGPEVPHILFAPSGETQHLMFSLAREISAYDTPVCLVTDTADPGVSTAHVVKVAAVSEAYSPLVNIVPVEFLCTLLAEREGMTPGELRRIPKVVVHE